MSEKKSDKERKYEPLSEMEKVLIYNYLERIKEDAHFKQAVLQDPVVALSSAQPTVTFAQLLRPNLLDVMGKLRRVSLEEIGIDIAAYRDYVADNGFKLAYDNKE